VLATVREVYVIWFRNLGTWLKLMALPSLAIVAAISAFRNVSISSDPEVDQIVVNLLLYILTFGIGVPAITAWHRLILRSKDGTAGRYRISRREFRYVALHIRFWVAVTVLNGVFLAVVFNLFPLVLPEFGNMSSARSVLVPLAFLTIIGFSAAFGLVFPAAAVGRDLSFRQSAQLTWGNRWRLILVSTAASIPVALFVYLLSSATSGIGHDLRPIVFEVVDELLNFLYLPTTVGFLSIAYRELVEKAEAAVN
jgi:hypothetical protein